MTLRGLTVLVMLATVLAWGCTPLDLEPPNPETEDGAVEDSGGAVDMFQRVDWRGEIEPPESWDALDADPPEDQGVDLDPFDMAQPLDQAPPPLDQGPPPPVDMAPPVDQAVPVDQAPPPGVTCNFAARPQGMQEVNTWRANVDQVTFTVQVPEGVAVRSATLLYRGHDMDHPGAEGTLRVNGGAPIDLPADAAWDNQTQDFSMDITASVRGGNNTLVFYAFPSNDGAYYQISNVQIQVTAPGMACDAPPPQGNGVERTMGYRQAQFEQRNNWVLDCRDYAYSARFDEHRECDGQYNPDGSGHGRAIFVFDNVIPDQYEILVEGRNTVNRNPSGCLVIVNGIEARLNQRNDRDYVFLSHSVQHLEGRVEVIIDSTRERASDSVRRVRIRPDR